MTMSNVAEPTGTGAGQTLEKGEPQKGVSPIRAGFRMVTPYLVAEDGPALMEFAKQAFGAEETGAPILPWVCTERSASAIPC
jgi:hypothetical protein